MTTGQRIIIMPDRDEIMTRLRGLDMGANDYMAERFYPAVAADLNNKELYPGGVALRLVLTIYDWVKQGGYPSVMIVVLLLYVPDILDAVIDDEDAAAEAKAHHAKAMKGE